jgi:Leucine-rich repeat (LRR) protein
MADGGPRAQLPPEVASLQGRLTTLALSNNQLKSLPDLLCAFAALKTLEVDRNLLGQFVLLCGPLAWQ